MMGIFAELSEEYGYREPNHRSLMRMSMISCGKIFAIKLMELFSHQKALSYLVPSDNIQKRIKEYNIDIICSNDHHHYNCSL